MIEPVPLQPNHGHCPGAARGKRVRGVLRGGNQFGFNQISPVTPPGWPADGKGGCRWTLEGHSHDILEWELA